MNCHWPLALFASIGFAASLQARAAQSGLSHTRHDSGAELVRQTANPQANATAPPAEGASPPGGGEQLPIIVRPATLAAQIAELAGHRVRVPYARVVGVLNPRAIVVDTAMRLRPVTGNRSRVLVLIDRGSLRIPAETVVSSTVTIVGVARTLLGMQVNREVPWPSELRPEVVQRLEIRAAILAGSVQSAEGIELTDSPAAQRVGGARRDRRR